MPDRPGRPLLASLGVVAMARVVHLAAALGTTVAVAGIAGVPDLGRFSATVAIGSLVGTLSLLGIHSLLVRELGALAEEFGPAERRFVIRSAARVGALLGTIVLFLAMVRSGTETGTSGPPSWEISGIAAIAGATALRALVGETYRGLGRVSLGAWLMTGLSHLVGLLCLLPFLAVSGKAADMNMAVLVLAGGWALPAVLGAFSLVRMTSTVPTNMTDRVYSLHGAGSFAVISTAALLMSQGDLILGDLVLSDQLVGELAIANRLMSVAGLPLMIANHVWAPKVAREFASRGALGAIERQIARTTRGAASMTLGLVATFVAACALLVEFGTLPYASLVPLVVVYGVARLVATATGPCGMLLEMSRNESAAAAGTVAGGVAMAAGAGAVTFLAGGAIAVPLVVLGATVVENAAQASSCVRRLGIRPWIRLASVADGRPSGASE